MEYPTFVYEFTVLEHHLDTFGHINNATYLSLYEEARWDFITERDYGLKKIQETQVGPTILEIQLHFKKEIKNRECIKIKTQLIEVRGKVCRLGQHMVNEDGDICSTVEMVIALFDLKKRKIIKPTKEWEYAIGIK